jgi:hypothetical protein
VDCIDKQAHMKYENIIVTIYIKIIDSHLIDYFRYKNMHFTTNSKNLSSHQLKDKIHFITVHIIRMKPFIDTVKKSPKKNQNCAEWREARKLLGYFV